MEKVEKEFQKDVIKQVPTRFVSKWHSGGESRNFWKGGLYTIVVTFNAWMVWKLSYGPVPLARALKGSRAMPLPPKK